MLDKLYAKLDTGTIQKNHVFIVKKDGKKLVMGDAEIVTQDILKRGQQVGLPERDEYLSSSFSICECPGLREIKQVEIYTKWRKFVPLRYRDAIYPKPSQEITNCVKIQGADKANQRTSAPAVAKGKKKSAHEKQASLQKKAVELAMKTRERESEKAAKKAAKSHEKQLKEDKKRQRQESKRKKKRKA
jgi:hypothetical protein